ncbi:MAG: 4-(cytidine 5'-diphospho)-2-C-methyl-D-erythritol kinase [Gemmatimonadetes bacterium]|nr:4-(cytidine 5'-diphospho)-2-C-methyl-D-erythritol kinase [Gemmatimonadota bacterium]NNM05919.1 4-(cytidine 5'-diphospho)-2-C-methyl-D-erythritol kinase [Gemmatimonadota bacterium]
MLTLHAPAKVNLFLRVLAREPSGYHQLETLFCSLEFGDTLLLERKESGISLEMDGPDICPPEENLVYRAARAFLRVRGEGDGVRIVLRKRIPTGAGLGGGSSDAGATLLGLTDLFPGRVDEVQLMSMAKRLGSDVPFFLARSSLALARGRGDRVRALQPLPPAPALLALPPLTVGTPHAYGLLARSREGLKPGHEARTFSAGDFSSWDALRALARNDFEDVIFQEYPTLRPIREALEETGPVLSLLSGSGSALFGVFSDETEALGAESVLAPKFPETRFVLTRTQSRWADPRLLGGVEREVGD